MATWDDVRRVACALPEVSEATERGRPVWSVRGKGFVWDRPLRRGDLAALGEAAPTGPVLCAFTADVDMKEALVAARPEVYFTTPHFAGFPAVLVRLDVIELAELEELVTDAWLARAPKRLAAAFLAE